MENPKISVVIPTKNEEANINACLRAIFSQSLIPHEVIVVDGRSHDKTIEKAKVFPVKIVSETFGTVGGARQKGLENSSGDYVAFTDSDCRPKKEWLEKLFQGFEEGIVAVGGGIQQISNGSFEEATAYIADTFLGSGKSVQGRNFGKKRAVKSISGCNSLYRKEALIEAGGFNVKLSVNEDTELNSRIRKIGKILYVPKAIVLHDLNIGPKDFAKRNFTFGKWRARLRLFDLQCIPPIALLFLIPFSFFYFWILIGVFCLYFLAVFGMGLKGALAKNRKSMLFFVPLSYLIEHLSYSTGFWLGLLKK